MKRILLVALLAAILCPVVAEAGPLGRIKDRAAKFGGLVVKVGGAVRGVCGRLG